MKLVSTTAVYISLLFSFGAQTHASPQIVDALDQITKLDCYLTGVSSLSTLNSKPLTLELVTHKTDHDTITNVRLDVAIYDRKFREYKLHLSGLDHTAGISGFLVIKKSNQSSFFTVEQFFADAGSRDLQHSPSAFCVLK